MDRSVHAPADAVCVVHLVWAPLGLEPFRRFVDSYRRQSAGAAHRLVMVYNGFAPGADRSAYQGELAGLPHSEMVLPRPGQDIAAYFAAAAATDADRVCFLNSYSVVLGTDWLRMLCSALDRSGMGAVGATGSAQSHLTYLRAEGWPPARRRWRQGFKDVRYRLELLRLWWRFPPFPNYHLRTNAFLIERRRFLDLRRPIRSKRAAERFESGYDGLTASLQAQGLTVGVVARDGDCHRPEKWAGIQTYRSGGQENLLVADNRTHEYAVADAAAQARMARWAWGDTAA
jgi:hypothetical protein